MDPFKIDGRPVVKKHALCIHISETCMEERRARQKLTAALSIDCMETAHIMVKDALQVCDEEEPNITAAEAFDREFVCIEVGSN